ncbi:MAG: T9SS type A sorting domain-containing protein, partial [Chlorobi bacterium]|nr:T9SS type A sorting domain-containing protein [Chlorobiota bacterium]
NEIPLEYKLSQNYPNPFNPVTKITYQIPKDEKVKIVISDVLGKELVILTDEFKKAGTHDITFDGQNYSSGVYFYRLKAGDFSDSKKMVLIK